MDDKKQFEERIVRLANIEAMIQFAYMKSLEFDNIEDLRKELKEIITSHNIFKYNILNEYIKDTSKLPDLGQAFETLQQFLVKNVSL